MRRRKQGIKREKEDDLFFNSDLFGKKQKQTKKRGQTYKCLSCGAETSAEDYCDGCYFDSMLS